MELWRSCKVEYDKLLNFEARAGVSPMPNVIPSFGSKRPHAEEGTIKPTNLASPPAKKANLGHTTLPLSQ